MKAYTQNTLFFIISLFLISCSDKNVNQDSEVKSHEDLEKELQIRSEEKEAYFKKSLSIINDTELKVANRIGLDSEADIKKALGSISKQKEQLASEMDDWINEMKIKKRELDAKKENSK